MKNGETFYFLETNFPEPICRFPLRNEDRVEHQELRIKITRERGSIGHWIGLNLSYNAVMIKAYI